MNLNSLSLSGWLRRVRHFLHMRNLHVLSREFTGVGSYTKFRCADKGAQTSLQPISLSDLIIVPGVQSGMGAVLFWEERLTKMLGDVYFWR